MTTFYLVKHGVREKICGDPELSKAGLLESEKTALFFNTIEIHEIYSSPLKRAKQTAKICAREKGLRVIVDPRLRERANWGDNKKQLFPEFLKVWGYCNSNRNFRPKVGNSSKEAGNRFLNFIDEIRTSSQNRNIAVFTHGGIITDFLRNLFSDSYLAKLSPTFKKKFDANVSDCSITIINWENNKYNLLQFASVKHLL